ncbi:cell division protein ZapA [Hathewaya proteolytica DSM 3090]|uniref:Cell division protein ZapA n=1 Tax=Hathewaya proteolytica DSM 3090 TaxID=1121331 RepID=A0A1M6QSQ8_9CLOT|nr:cell division protein ZapA [Hathewaya proteolytica]SHK23148.1 cell division protein ZapA [Hathewaya proteolytica DSM 3090]
MNVVTVKINEMEYSLTGSEDVEYIKVLADYVNEKVRAIKSNNNKLGTSELSVLAAINIVDELIKLKTQKDKVDDTAASLKENNEELIKKNEQLLDILEKSQNAIKNMRENINQLEESSNNLQQDIQNVQKQNSLLQEENIQLQSRVNELESETKELKQPEISETSSNAIDILMEENEALRKKLISTIEQNKFMEQKTKKYVQEIKNLKNENKLYKKV